MSGGIEELELLAREAVAGPQPGLTPAELHGATVGIAVTTPEPFRMDDLVALLGAEALADAGSLDRFVRRSLEALGAPDMSFTLLLPDEGASMAERTTALAAWCQSFLAGLAAGLARRGIRKLDEVPEDVQEIVRDFSAIAQLDTELAEASGEDEADFMQLEEFVKVGVLLIMSLAGDAGDDSEE